MKQIKAWAVGFFIVTLLIYSLSHRGEGSQWDYFSPLSQAFLQGRLDVVEHPGWLNELVNVNQKWYVVLPPMPAVILMPWVAFFGQTYGQLVLSIFCGALNASLCFMALYLLFKNKSQAVWATVFYAFGAMNWYHAEVGSSWYTALIVGQTFLWLMISEVLTKQRLWLIGVLIGGAYLTRLPMIFSVAFVLIYLNEQFINLKKMKINLKNFFSLGLGIGLALVINGFYNFFRFGVFYDIGYEILLKHDPTHPLGVLNIAYIPIHLKEIFLAMPIFLNHWPYLIPSALVMSLIFVSPGLLLISWADFKSRIIWAALVTVMLVAIPSLIKGGNGLTQFGYRYALDYMPFLMILFTSGFIRTRNSFGKALIILSVLINLWGVVMISFLNIWTLQGSFLL